MVCIRAAYEEHEPACRDEKVPLLAMFVYQALGDFCAHQKLEDNIQFILSVQGYFLRTALGALSSTLQKTKNLKFCRPRPFFLGGDHWIPAVRTPVVNKNKNQKS